MSKTYQISEPTPLSVSEPAVAYSTSPLDTKWNPNVPFIGTQEEWREHFHRIEEGPFYPATETHQRISQWLDNQGK
jgi:hypothetical protein